MRRSKRLQFTTVISLLCSYMSLASGQSIPADQLRPLGEVWKTIEANFYLEVDRNDLMQKAIDGLLKVDPYGAYFNEAAYKELKNAIASSFAGIGVEIAKKDDAFRVVTPIEGSPAAAAGMRPNDLIVRVDDSDLKDKTLEQVVQLIRGLPGTQVTVRVLRSGAPLELRLTRRVVRLNSVRSKLLDPGIAYVRVSQFSDLTPEIFSKEVVGLLDRQPKGFVLDLRSNPGGLFTAATAVASAFLPEDLLVVKLDGRSKQEFRTTDKPYVSATKTTAAPLPRSLKTIPLAVLIDGGTASGAEIVAAALNDHRRAVLVGQNTFGKGAVQTIFVLPGNTAMRLSTAVTITPAGRPIDGLGVQPTTVVETTLTAEDFGSEKDDVLQAALRELSRRAGK